MNMINDTDYRVPQVWLRAEDDSTLPSEWKQNCYMSDDQLSTFCICQKCTEDGCFWCCPKIGDCCFCYHCTKCWSTDWSLITATQVSIFILFLLGIVSVIAMYFRICRRSTQGEYARQPVLHSEQNEECLSGVSPCRPTGSLRDRPPSYNEACGAPPLYNSPYNRVSMLDAPPVYPDTPKTSERVSHSNDPTITHHI